MTDRIEVDAVVESRFLVRHPRVVDSGCREGWTGFLFIRVGFCSTSPPRANCGSVLHDFLTLVEGLVPTDFRKLRSCSWGRDVE